MDKCPQCFITKSIWKDDEGRSYRLAFCLVGNNTCDFPAKLCVYKYQMEIKQKRPYEIMRLPNG